MTIRTPAEVLAAADQYLEHVRQRTGEAGIEDDAVRVTYAELRAWADPWRDSRTDPPDFDGPVLWCMGPRKREQIGGVIDHPNRTAACYVRDFPALHPWWMPLPEAKR